MSKKHLKIMATPKSWPVERKKGVYITRPSPGAHKMELSLSINYILKLLKFVNTTKETKRLIHERKILVNDIPVKDLKFPAGVMDVVTFTNTNDAYRVLLNKIGKLALKKIDKKESKVIPQKIVRKTKLKTGKLQLNFESGLNSIVKDDKYKTNDVLVLEKNTVKEHIIFEKNALVYILKGKHIGQIAKISEILKGPELGKYVKLELNKLKINVPKANIMVIGKEKPIISIDEK